MTRILWPMRVLVIAVLAGSVLTAAPRQQQTPPATEVFLKARTGPDADIWINISNNTGYDNQPSFLPDSSGVLFSSNRDGKQTDIYRYDIRSKRLTQLTKTPEAEYSPTVTPDRRSFSAVRVEADGTQRLWRFDRDGGNPGVVLENVKPVGYHAWIDSTHLALFVLGADRAPATLQIADTKTGMAETVATGIGRSVLVRPPTGTVSFMMTGDRRMLREYHPKTKQITDLIVPVEGSQDAAWTPDGQQLLMAQDAMIYAATFVSQRTVGWAQRYNLASHVMDATRPSVRSITRMAVSPDGSWLAFVAELRGQ